MADEAESNPTASVSHVTTDLEGARGNVIKCSNKGMVKRMFYVTI